MDFRFVDDDLRRDGRFDVQRHGGGLEIIKMNQG
jgi:hypothetical protein